LMPVESSAPSVVSHTGLAASMKSAWLDESGRVFLETDLGLGLVHTLDMGWAADAVEAGWWSPQDVAFDSLATRFKHRLKPAPTSVHMP
jgi:hypothetical protein